MSDVNLMKQALGAQWLQLPPALCAHYQESDNADIGALDIEYPRAMQFWLNILHMLGALINRSGKAIPTTVEKHMDGKVQYWARSIKFADGQTVLFKSHWVYAGGNRLIEYVNPLLGLCMSVRVVEGELHYEGRHYVVKLGKLHLPLPEWLVLGHTSIVETALDSSHFRMDFRLRHPLFGQIYRYAGQFRTEQGRAG